MKSLKDDLDDEYVTAREISLDPEISNLQFELINDKKEENKKSNEEENKGNLHIQNVAYIPKTPNNYQFKVNRTKLMTPMKKKISFKDHQQIDTFAVSNSKNNVIFHSNINFNFINPNLKENPLNKFSRQYPPDIVEIKKRNKHKIFFEHLAKMQEFSLGNAITTAELNSQNNILAIGLENGNLVVIQKANFSKQCIFNK